MEELKSYSLDVPQVTELAYELRRSGLEIPEGILSQQELLDCLLPLFAEKFPGENHPGCETVRREYVNSSGTSDAHLRAGHGF